MLSRLFKCYIYCLAHRYLTKSPVAINDCCDWIFAHDFYLSIWYDFACFNVAQILRNANDTVRVMTGAVGFCQQLGDDTRVFRRRACSDENFGACFN